MKEKCNRGMNHPQVISANFLPTVIHHKLLAADFDIRVNFKFRVERTKVFLFKLWRATGYCLCVPTMRTT
jgi:hypothetical protein